MFLLCGHEYPLLDLEDSLEQRLLLLPHLQ
jgi:hypothetical protein